MHESIVTICSWMIVSETYFKHCSVIKKLIMRWRDFLRPFAVSSIPRRLTYDGGVIKLNVTHIIP